MAVSAPPRPPVRDDPEALIPEARERQRRRQLLALATIAVAVALGLGIYGAASGGGPLGAVQGSFGLGGTPKVCRSSQLETQPVAMAFGIAAPAGGLLLTNASGSACSLPSGTPRISLIWHGQRLAVRQIHVAHFFRMIGLPVAPVTHVLGPSKSGEIDFVWRNWCGPPNVRLPLAGRAVHVGTAGRATRHPMIFRFRFGNAAFASLRGYARPQCAHPGAPSTITATQPLRWPS